MAFKGLCWSASPIRLQALTVVGDRVMMTPTVLTGGGVFILLQLMPNAGR